MLFIMPWILATFDQTLAHIDQHRPQFGPNIGQTSPNIGQHLVKFGQRWPRFAICSPIGQMLTTIDRFVFGQTWAKLGRRRPHVGRLLFCRCLPKSAKLWPDSANLRRVRPVVCQHLPMPAKVGSTSAYLGRLWAESRLPGQLWGNVSATFELPRSSPGSPGGVVFGCWRASVRQHWGNSGPSAITSDYKLRSTSTKSVSTRVVQLAKAPLDVAGVVLGMAPAAEIPVGSRSPLALVLSLCSLGGLPCGNC